MWKCARCGRIFSKAGQTHSCRKVPLELHFEKKSQAKALFEELVSQIEGQIGKCQLVSLPCCIHLFGKYDFLAALPKRDRLEIRFGLNRKLESPRLRVGVPVSARVYKNCVDIAQKEEIDGELMGWIREAYWLKG